VARKAVDRSSSASRPAATAETLQWLVLGATRDRVTAEYTHGSQKRAEDILLDGLEQRLIRWRYWKLRMQDPQYVWTIEAVDRFFWDRLGAGEVVVDWINHDAVRTGPAQVLMGEKGARILANGPRTVLEMLQISLCWNDVLDFLRLIGLPRSSDPLSAPTPTSASVPAPSPLQVEVIRLPPIAMMAPQRGPSEPPRRQVTAVEWITGEAQRLKRDNKIPAGISKTAFAQMLATNMEEAAKTDHSISIKPVGPGYILNQLEGWSLWPISSIK